MHVKWFALPFAMLLGMSAHAADKVKIGFISTLSGPLAALGTEIRDGFRLGLDETGRFCGAGAGWKVFPPDSSHFPTVTGGRVTMLFFLPGGQIEYRNPPSAP